jgi:proton glutamate symport protein
MRILTRPFFRAILELATLAFATTSSEAALPIAMENMEKFGVPRKTVAFVIPTGYSFNLSGTRLYMELPLFLLSRLPESTFLSKPS